MFGRNAVRRAAVDATLDRGRAKNGHASKQLLKRDLATHLLVF